MMAAWKRRALHVNPRIKGALFRWWMMMLHFCKNFHCDPILIHQQKSDFEVSSFRRIYDLMPKWCLQVMEPPGYKNVTWMAMCWIQIQRDLPFFFADLLSDLRLCRLVKSQIKSRILRLNFMGSHWALVSHGIGDLRIMPCCKYDEIFRYQIWCFMMNLL